MRSKSSRLVVAGTRKLTRVAFRLFVAAFMVTVLGWSLVKIFLDLISWMKGPHPERVCSAMMSGFNRELLMTALALHYSSMRLFDTIFILWANQTLPDTFVTLLESSLNEDVHIIHINDDLNKRFSQFHKLRTECVFIMDDDIFVEEKTVEDMFAAWSVHKTDCWPLAACSWYCERRGNLYFRSTLGIFNGAYKIHGFACRILITILFKYAASNSRLHYCDQKL